MLLREVCMSINRTMGYSLSFVLQMFQHSCSSIKETKAIIRINTKHLFFFFFFSPFPQSFLIPFLISISSLIPHSYVRILTLDFLLMCNTDLNSPECRVNLGLCQKTCLQIIEKRNSVTAAYRPLEMPLKTQSLQKLSQLMQFQGHSKPVHIN